MVLATGLFLLVSLAVAWAEPAPLPRVAHTTLRMPSSAQPFGYTSENALAGVNFTNPVAIASPPGETNRLFILERDGRVVAITNLAAPTRTVFLDLTGVVAPNTGLTEESGALGLAFHPGYATNRYFYVFYTTRDPALDLLSRFVASLTDPARALPASEVVLLNQPDRAVSHNAGDLHFGPDGYLYVSLGDGNSADSNAFTNSQRIDLNFFSGILRLDVDKRPGSLPPNSHPAATANYAVPPDNPFVGATTFNGLPVDPASVRTEFWAVGLREPWRFSFDPVTATLYCGDVGHQTSEEIDVITRGGNYGWAFREGFVQRPGADAPPAGFTAHEPLYEYPGDQGAAVIGGVVCRGSTLPELSGDYIFGDYVQGNIWALRHDGTNVTRVQTLLNGVGVVCFGTDPRNGDVLFANLREGTNATIERLVALPPRLTRIEFRPDGAIRLEGAGHPECIYNLETTTDLNEWTGLDAGEADADGKFEFIDAAAPQFPARFYRVTQP